MNTITMIGRLARDPQIRQITEKIGSSKVASFPLVVKRNHNTKVFVVMVSAYGSLADVVENHLSKGTKIALSGELVISSVKDEKTGKTNYFTEIIMGNMEFCESKASRDNDEGMNPFDIPEGMEAEMPFR